MTNAAAKLPTDAVPAPPATEKRAAESNLHPGEQRVLRHMTQLDPLRAFAVMLVMVQHWLQPEGVRFPLGSLGVRLFFVLSGFLITGILLQCRELGGQTGQSVWFTARQFYARRFLRIFPLFYGVIALAIVLNVPGMRDQWKWHVLYLSNFQQILHPNTAGAASHFWSLAVEEQFYLAWPWVILLVPRRALLGAIMATILVAPAWRTIGFLSGYSPNSISFAPYACLDTLGMGALLALLADKQSRLSAEMLGRILTAALVAGIAFFSLAMLTRFQLRGLRVLDAAFYNFGLGLIFFWLIGRASRGFTGPVGKVLSLKPLIYLGAISYGIYVYHNFLPSPANPINHFLYKLPRGARWAGLTVLAVVVPTISWFCYEKPINGMKRYFEYRKQRLA